jgi:hypothetical protein
MKQFETILEDYMERYKNSGFVTGDWVKFKSNALQHPFIKSRGTRYIEMIKDFMKSDLHLKVACVKRPIDAFTTGPAEEIDIVREYAPGLWADPMTVPVDVLEVIDTGINAFQHPVPDSLKRPNREHGPEPIKAKPSAEKAKTEVNLTNKNTNINKGKKWNDSKPGAGNVPKSVYSTGK